MARRDRGRLGDRAHAHVDEFRADLIEEEVDHMRRPDCPEATVIVSIATFSARDPDHRATRKLTETTSACPEVSIAWTAGATVPRTSRGESTVPAVAVT